jgi:hypothetical protein
MKQTYRDESFLIFALGTLLVFFTLVFSSCSKVPNQPKIIKQITDNRGFTSVIFVEGKDTLAYDYLTPKEYKRFKYCMDHAH